MAKIYEYVVNLEANMEVFQRTCAQIEKYFPDCHKGLQNVDVDGTVIQLYNVGDKRIIVLNDCDMIDEVYVDSEVDLEGLFGKHKRVYER